MQKYINEILLRINEEMELRGIDENVNTEDALYMIDVIRPLFEKLREMTIAYEFQSEQEEIHFFKEMMYSLGIYETNMVREPIIALDAINHKITDELIERYKVIRDSL